MTFKKGTFMKMISAVAAMMFAASVNAADLSASYVRDSNLSKDGVRVETSVGSVMGVKPVLSVTHVDNAYTRYGVAADVGVAKVGPVALSASGSTVFQDTRVGANGFGLTVGAKASVALMKNVELVGRVDRFMGQSRVNNFNGTVSSVGVALKF